MLSSKAKLKLSSNQQEIDPQTVLDQLTIYYRYNFV